MSEVPDYERLLNEYVMNSFYPKEQEQCASPMYVSKADLVHVDQCQLRRNMFDEHPLTPPEEKDDNVLRRMSETELFNVLSPNSNENKYECVSPATIYQSRVTPTSNLLTSFSDAGIYNSMNSNCSSNSNSDHSDNEDQTFRNLNNIISSTNSPFGNNASSTSAIKKPKRKTRLCSLTQFEKSERRKKQNRLAASRCRKKKQAALSEMEDTANKVRAENAVLLEEIAALKATIEELKKNRVACPRECCQNKNE